VTYRHGFLDGSPSTLETGKVLCIGKNYRAKLDEPVHISEDYPVVFMKPPCALVPLEEPVRVPGYSPCYYEVELAVLVGSELYHASRERVRKGIAGYAIALDLTLKELLDQLKRAGRPWELAKSFDRSCPISPFVDTGRIKDPDDTTIRLAINDEIRQEASTKLMMRTTLDLISLISAYITLLPGDVVLTGTPEGAGMLPSKATLFLELDDKYRFRTSVV